MYQMMKVVLYPISSRRYVLGLYHVRQSTGCDNNSVNTALLLLIQYIMCDELSTADVKKTLLSSLKFSSLPRQSQRGLRGDRTTTL
jgi:hypothetical protein